MGSTGKPEHEVEFSRDQVTQAVTVGLCFTLAAVLIVLEIV